MTIPVVPKINKRGAHMRTCKCTPPTTCGELVANESKPHTKFEHDRPSRSWDRYRNAVCTCARAEAALPDHWIHCNYSSFFSKVIRSKCIAEVVACDVHVMQMFLRKNVRFHPFSIAGIGASLRRTLRADCRLKKDYNTLVAVWSVHECFSCWFNTLTFWQKLAINLTFSGT